MTDIGASLPLGDHRDILVPATILVDATTGLPIDLGNLTVTLTVGDVEIGAVELKDATTGNRASIDASGRLAVDGSSVTQPVSAVSLPLPSGAATEAGQTSALSALEDIVDNTAAGATAANQATGNAALAAIQAKLESTVAVTQSGAWAVSFTVPQHVIIDSSATIAVTGPLTDAQLRAVAVPVSGAFYQVTQPVSAASLPLPTGAAIESKQDTGNASLASIDGKIPALEGGRIPVVLPAGGGGLTDTELRASAVPVSAATLPLPTDAATETTLATLTLAQSSDGSDATGPLVQGLVSDTPQPKTDGVVSPLSINSEGRLRVASVATDLTEAWRNFLPTWPSDCWSMESPYV